MRLYLTVRHYFKVFFAIVRKGRIFTPYKHTAKIRAKDPALTDRLKIRAKVCHSKIYKMKHIIILTKKGETPESWGSFTKLCKAHGFPYHYLKMLKFPFERDGWTLTKVKHNERSN